MEVDFVSLEEDNLIVVFVCDYKLERRMVTNCETKQKRRKRGKKETASVWVSI